MSVRTLILVLLVVLLVVGLPTWPYSHAWGYYPSGALGVILVVLLILVVLGQI